MEGLTLQHILTHGTLYMLATGVLIIGSLIYNQRLWMNDYPKEVQAMQPPLTEGEKRDRIIVTVLLMGVVFGGLFASNAALKAANGGALPFLTLYANTLILFNLFNLFDAVVIDWLLGAVLKAPFMIMPGSEGIMHLYRDWNLHITNYVKGVLIAFVVSLPVAFISTVV